MDGGQPVLGKVPQRMIVGILDSTAFNGDKETYPFAFQKKRVSAVRQFIEREEYPYVHNRPEPRF